MIGDEVFKSFLDSRRSESMSAFEVVGRSSNSLARSQPDHEMHELPSYDFVAEFLRKEKYFKIMGKLFPKELIEAINFTMD